MIYIADPKRISFWRFDGKKTYLLNGEEFNCFPGTFPKPLAMKYYANYLKAAIARQCDAGLWAELTADKFTEAEFVRWRRLLVMR
jgi:hypothetical protein